MGCWVVRDLGLFIAGVTYYVIVSEAKDLHTGLQPNEEFL